MIPDNNGFVSAESALYSALHQARTKEAIEAAAKRRERTIEDMREYMRRADIRLPEVGGPSIVHITGTKGKGSTASMCESILRRRYSCVTGMFTSPHLIDIRERIRVNGSPVSREVFGKAYWQVRKRLESYSENSGDLPLLPGYFRMLVLVALYVFSRYSPTIDVIILEVGMGGRYDATNIIDTDQRNVVCGIAQLDFDHTRVLGDTLEQIAWEKGGIFKVHKDSKSTELSNAEGLQITTGNKRLFAIGTNPSSCLEVLRHCARIEGEGQDLQVIDHSARPNLELGLQGDHQRINAELAIALCTSLMTNPEIDLGENVMNNALKETSWPGRCQTVEVSRNLVIRLDGAHTPKSIEASLKWYMEKCSEPTQECERCLIFNCSHERNPVPLLQTLQSAGFHRVYFCPADFERPSAVGKSSANELLTRSRIPIPNNRESAQATTWQDTLAEIWMKLEQQPPSHNNAIVHSNIKVSAAISRIESDTALQEGTRTDVFVVGSLYIVGSALQALGWKENDANGNLCEP